MHSGDHPAVQTVIRSVTSRQLHFFWMTSARSSELMLVFMVILTFSWRREDRWCSFQHKVRKEQTSSIWSSINIAIHCKVNPLTFVSFGGSVFWCGPRAEIKTCELLKKYIIQERKVAFIRKNTNPTTQKKKNPNHQTNKKPNPKLNKKKKTTKPKHNKPVKTNQKKKLESAG